jgi:hypothetical protein
MFTRILFLSQGFRRSFMTTFSSCEQRLHHIDFHSAFEVRESRQLPRNSNCQPLGIISSSCTFPRFPSLSHFSIYTAPTVTTPWSALRPQSLLHQRNELLVVTSETCVLRKSRLRSQTSGSTISEKGHSKSLNQGRPPLKQLAVFPISNAF